MTPIQQAHEVLKLIEYGQDAIDKMVSTVAEIYGADEGLDEEQYAEKHETLQVLREVCEETIDGLMDDVAKTYAEHYTPEELTELTAWYSSPLGRKTLAESKSLFLGISKLVEEWGTELWKVVRVRRGFNKED